MLITDISITKLEKKTTYNPSCRFTVIFVELYNKANIF